MKWRVRWYFIKPWKKNFPNLFSTWEKCVSLNYGNFCRTTHLHLLLLSFLLICPLRLTLSHKHSPDSFSYSHYHTDLHSLLTLMLILTPTFIFLLSFGLINKLSHTLIFIHLLKLELKLTLKQVNFLKEASAELS